jgi:hypothetical protein
MLEPLLRKLSKNNEVTIATRFPDVYNKNDYLSNIVPMESKDNLPVDVNSYDIYDDLRSYSETCENRDIKHRTDCYNQVFDLNLSDGEKEPRIYFEKNEKSILSKRGDKNYIGIACDGSHYFRRYFYGNDLINYILKADKNNIVVILGDGWEDGQGFVKAKPDKRIINYQGKTTIRQAINIIKDLDYLISVDTGLLHIGLSLHIPTVGIFSIVDPELRVNYYRGQKEIIYKSELQCIGCGSLHMEICKHKKISKDRIAFGRASNQASVIPPCLEIQPNEIYDRLSKMHPEENKRCFYREKQIIEKKAVNMNVLPKKKLVMPIIVQNEEINLPRFIELVMSHKSIGRVIAIDGGSKDNTKRILEKAGAEVYIHPYNPDYHDMQAMQRNISCSYVQDGERILIMDIDECFSKGLSEYLPVLTETHAEHIALSRRTFQYFDDIDDPNKQIKDYPDYQPRFFIWKKWFKWVGSPHHNIYNCSAPEKIRKDIIHFECEGKDRGALERKWSKMQKKTRRVYA